MANKATPYNPATDYMQPPEEIVVDKARVSCDGGGGALGHPRVWLQIGAEGYIDCPYCDRRYVLRR